MRFDPKLIIPAVLLPLLTAPTGCVDPTQIFADEFLNATIGGQNVASLPGNAPSVLLAVENQTALPTVVNVRYRLANNDVRELSLQMLPGERSAQALACPIDEITVGELTDPSQAGAFVYLDTDADATLNLNAPFVTVEPFGVILRNDTTYTCGDEITFAVVPSSATASGYRVVAFVTSGS